MLSYAQSKAKKLELYKKLYKLKKSTHKKNPVSLINTGFLLWWRWGELNFSDAMKRNKTVENRVNRIPYKSTLSIFGVKSDETK